MGVAVFVGILTFDVAYQLPSYPIEDSKNLAQRQFTGAGGPSANAAVTHAALAGLAGGRTKTRLVTSVGSHPLAQLARAEVESFGVEVVDVTPGRTSAPPISSIISAADTQSRTIVSRDGADIEVPPPAELPLDGASIVLVDGHYPQLCAALARAARQRGLEVVFDGGRFRTEHEQILRHVSTAICASSYRPHPHLELVASLSRYGVCDIAVTAGAQSVRYWTLASNRADGPVSGAVDVSGINVVDTLGAGDVLHGAFCWFRSQSMSFPQALAAASEIATLSCQFFGTRGWISHLSEREAP